jgi:hypothetical protein
MNHTISDKASRRTVLEAVKEAYKSGETDAMDAQSKLNSAYGALEEGNKETALEHAINAMDAAERSMYWAKDIVRLLQGEDPYGDTNMETDA